MAIYGNSTLPLLSLISQVGVLQKWYADKSNAAIALSLLCALIDNLKGGRFKHLIQCKRSEMMADYKTTSEGKHMICIRTLSLNSH